MTTTEPPTNAEALQAANDDELVTMYQHHSEQNWRTMSRPNLLTWQREIADRGLATRLQKNLRVTTLPHTRAIVKAMEKVTTPAEVSDGELAVLKDMWETASTALKPVARLLGLSAPSQEDQADRLFFTRLANDPRHPMTHEMADVMMHLTHQQRLEHVKGYMEQPGGWTVNRALEEWLRSPMSVETGKVAGSLPEATKTSSTDTVPPELPTFKYEGLTPIGAAWTGPETVPDAEAVPTTDLPSSSESSGALTSAASTLQSEVYLRLLPLEAKRDAFVHDGFLYVRRSVLQEWWAHFNAGKCCTQQRSGLSGHSSSCWIYADAVR